MRCNKRDREFISSQTHGEIFYAAALGKKFRLSGEPEANFVHPGFVNWPSHKTIEFAASGECYRLLERRRSGASSFRCRLAGLTIGLAPDDDVLSRIGNAPRFQSKLNDLRSNSGAIAKCNSDPSIGRAPAHDRNRIGSLGTNRVTATKKKKIGMR